MLGSFNVPVGELLGVSFAIVVGRNPSRVPFSRSLYPDRKSVVEGKS